MPIEHNNTILKRCESLRGFVQTFLELVSADCDLQTLSCHLGMMVRRFAAVIEANNPEFVQLIQVMDFLGAQISAQAQIAIKHHAVLRQDYLDSHGEDVHGVVIGGPGVEAFIATFQGDKIVVEGPAAGAFVSAFGGKKLVVENADTAQEPKLNGKPS